MNPLGEASHQRLKPSSSQPFNDDAVTKHRMEPTHNPESPGNETSARSLAERVRDLAAGRRSSTAPSSSSSSEVRYNPLTSTPGPRPNSNPTKHVDPEQAFLDTCRRKMDKTRPLKERITAIIAVQPELENYSVDTLMTLLAEIEDLYLEDAPLEGRKACYELLQAASLHSGLFNEDRIRLFSIIRTPIAPRESKPRILALRALLRDGSAVQPIQIELLEFLVHELSCVFDATLDARSSLKKSRSRRSKDPIAEEEVLEELLSLIRDVALHSPEVLSRGELGNLLLRLTTIANKTTVQKDLNQIASIFAAVTTSTSLPLDNLRPCVEVLSGIACTVDPQAGESSWHAFKNLLTSEDQARTLEILLAILHESRKDRQSVAVRGALLTVKHTLEADGQEGLPVVPFQALLNALQAVAPISSRLRIDCLQVLISCLEEPHIDHRLLAADWSVLEDIIYGHPLAGAKDDLTKPPRYKLSASSPLYIFGVSGQVSESSSNEGTQQEQVQLAYQLEARWSDLEETKRNIVLRLLLHVGGYIDDYVMDLAVDHMLEDGMVFPPDDNWRLHLQLLLDIYAFDPSKAVKVRTRVLGITAEAIQHAKSDAYASVDLEDFVLYITKALSDSKETAITNVVAEFGVDFALDSDMKTFEALLEFLLQIVGLEINTPTRSPTPCTLPENRAATCLVRLFLQCLSESASKTKKTYEALITIVSNRVLPTDARLTVMKLLTRIRCNCDHELMIVSVPDTLGLAATLYRTEATSQSRASTYGKTNRASMIGDSPGARVGRTSGVDYTGLTRSRSTTRSGGARERSTKAVPPLWMYPGYKGLPVDPQHGFSKSVLVHENGNDLCEDEYEAVLGFGSWLDVVLDTLEKGGDWEIYSYILVHLPSQLSNIALFADCGDFLQALHRVISTQLRTGNLHEPPPSTGIKKGDIAVCLYHSLTVLVNHQKQYDREQLDETVRTFLTGIGMWDRAAQCCVHALGVCAHEIPSNLRRSLFVIIQKMAQIITQSHLAIDILEFLAGLVRLPEAYQIAGPDGQDFLRTIFGICISYIHHFREQREREHKNNLAKSGSTPARLSGFSSRSVAASDGSQVDEAQKDLPEYVLTLAYHVMTYWFLAIDLRERCKHVGWIVKNLTWKDEQGKEYMEEQSQVTLDMIHRTVYNDLGETKANEDFTDANGPISKETWLYGMSIITLETVQASGLTHITKRQASGTTHAMYQQYTAQLPPHHVPMPRTLTGGGADVTMKVFPQHVLLQLGFTIAPVPMPLQPILLPEDDTVKRAINSFDRNDTVDGHKAGLIYISEGQSTESDILANTYGTKAYDDFLAGLGARVRLQDAAFNTQGLDRVNDMDGTHTYAWRDRVSEIVFHVTTMMPTNKADDPHCISKKRHIGNDYVNIIYNDSGSPFSFDTFSSQFNHVNIVVTPEIAVRHRPVLLQEPSEVDDSGQLGNIDLMNLEDTLFFTVQIVCSPSFPPISPAATPKIVSVTVLPGFVRQLALNASVFSLVWSNRDGGQNVSSWRNRLKEIMRMRQRYANTGTSANVSYPGMGTPSDRGGAPSYVNGDEWKGNLAMAGLVEQDQFLYSADFTRWN